MTLLGTHPLQPGSVGEGAEAHTGQPYHRLLVLSISKERDFCVALNPISAIPPAPGHSLPTRGITPLLTTPSNADATCRLRTREALEVAGKGEPEPESSDPLGNSPCDTQAHKSPPLTCRWEHCPSPPMLSPQPAVPPNEDNRSS